MSRANETASPTTHYASDGIDSWEYMGGGMTIRERFAMAAMQALIGTAAAPCLGGLDGFEPHTAKAAVRMADALIAALEQQP